MGTTIGGPIGGTITVSEDIELESIFVSYEKKMLLLSIHIV